MEEIINTAKIDINNYINKIPISKGLKQKLQNDIHLENNPFYFIYPQLFCGSFLSISSDKLILLNIAGYFYYQYLLLTDDILDTNKNKQNIIKDKFLYSHIYYEESIKILTTLFRTIPEFWVIWNKRKNEYLSALLIDKSNKKQLSKSQFEELASNKSSFGKVAIDALFLLNHNENTGNYDKLILSHKFFSCGFQLLDDVKDFTNDIQNHQTNYAVIRLLKHLKEKKINYSLFDINKLKKYLYIREIGQQMLDESLKYFNDAIKLISDLNVPLWKKVIELKYNEAHTTINSVNFFLNAIVIKASYEKKLNRNIINTISTNNHTWKKHITDAINLGTSFIYSKQEKNGHWKDSPVNAWFSTYWCTGWVLYCISDLPSEFLNNEKINRAINFLQSNNKNMWGYLEDWISDSDSTSFVMLALLSHNKNINHIIKEWIKYQNEDGGFAAYNNDNFLINSLNDSKIKDVTGWVNSQVCVSAAALLVLEKIKTFKNKKNNLVQYLINKQGSNNLWESYWWTSSLYSSSLIIEASSYSNNNKLKFLSKKAVSAIASIQNKNGSFSDTFTANHPLYTSMGLKALCILKEKFLKNKLGISRACKWLINNQYKDGSWSASYALRIPAANVIDSMKIKNWKKTDLGENVLIEDINKIVTTSSIISALNLYAKRAGIYN